MTARVSAGSGVGVGSTFVFDIMAATTFEATPVLANEANRDHVSVEARTGHVELTKTVQNETEGTAEGTSNQGQGGDVLLYRIYLHNTSPTSVADVQIFDRTPPYTSLSEAVPDPVVISPELTCNLTKPATNAAAYQGPLQWDCAGSFLPGQVGSVTFRVVITP